MERDPEVLLVGQPTRGVDIGAIEFIHQQIVARTSDVVFFQANGLALALFGRSALAEDAEVEDRPSGFSGITIAQTAQ